MLIAGRNGKPVDRDTKNSGTVSNCVAVAAPVRPLGIAVNLDHSLQRVNARLTQVRLLQLPVTSVSRQ